MPKNSKSMRALSLFASAGLAEFGFKNTAVEVVLASELIKKRLDVHEFWHPKVATICGDITNASVKDAIISASLAQQVDFIFATPPCQGASLIGKNKTNQAMANDQRNRLIFDVFEIIDKVQAKVILIENVPRFFKIKFLVKDKHVDIKTIINERYQSTYNIDFQILNVADYGVAQHRERAIIRLWKNDYVWENPIKQKHITLKQAIGHLPSLESNQISNLKNHSARKHTNEHIIAMKHTPSGKSAFENLVHYPKNVANGQRIKAYVSSYKRMDWNKPAPTITMRNDCISSQNNVHPGRELNDKTFSDARVLSIRELFILSSINPDLDLPPFASDIQIRHMIGEGVPPRLIHVIVKKLKRR